MAKEIQLISIDDQLRFTLFGLECALNVELDATVVEQVFSDAEGGSSSEKRYIFWAGSGTEITGYVEDYEPGDLWLTVQSRQNYKPLLSVIAERAGYHVLRWAKWREAAQPTV